MDAGSVWAESELYREPENTEGYRYVITYKS